MVNLTKSQPAPECLEKEKGKKNGDYKCGNVIKRLKEDFLNKCYLCETEAPQSINVEHFVPHKGNTDLKFDWNNLFFCCAHCNNTKLAKTEYDNILNCIQLEHDVERWIKYEIKPFPKEKVVITAMKQDDKMVCKTIRLLEAIYNGSGTNIKELESENLRDDLVNEICNFQKALMKYDKEPDKSEKAGYFKHIKRHLNKASAFCAFKRWIIRENEYLYKEFGQFIDQETRF